MIDTKIQHYSSDISFKSTIILLLTIDKGQETQEYYSGEPERSTLEIRLSSRRSRLAVIQSLFTW